MSDGFTPKREPLDVAIDRVVKAARVALKKTIKEIAA